MLYLHMEMVETMNPDLPPVPPPPRKRGRPSNEVVAAWKAYEEAKAAYELANA